MGDLTKKDDPLTDCYEVTLQAYCTVFVRGAKNESEAYELATDEISNGDFIIDGGETQQLTESEVNSSRRHADARSEPR